MKDFFNIDDDYLEDEESEEAKRLKEKIVLSLVSISQSITQAQTNLDAGLYTKFLKNINYMKGMIELLSDLTKVFAKNFNVQHNKAFEDNPRIFFNYNGIFSHMYDSAHRNGNIIIPFRQTKIVGNKGKNKSFL